MQMHLLQGKEGKLVQKQMYINPIKLNVWLKYVLYTKQMGELCEEKGFAIWDLAEVAVCSRIAFPPLKRKSFFRFPQLSRSTFEAATPLTNFIYFLHFGQKAIVLDNVSSSRQTVPPSSGKRGAGKAVWWVEKRGWVGGRVKGTSA